MGIGQLWICEYLSRGKGRARGREGMREEGGMVERGERRRKSREGREAPRKDKDGCSEVKG
jgi:hypothetical protein